jgi:chromosomal replication initiator protein
MTLQAGDFEGFLRSDGESPEETDDQLDAARQCDLLIIEDLQHLLPQNAHRRGVVAEALVQLFDDRRARARQMVFTATVGPGQLPRMPARLLSRLGSGLVVGLTALQESSRLEVLQEKAQERQLAVSRDVLGWLAKHLVGGGRQLEGAIAKLEILTRQRRGPLDATNIAAHFRIQRESGRATVEKIARHVGSYYQIDARQLQSRRRHQSLLLPRQVGMYLTRKLTDLTLEEIGAYFGQRHHTTVLHACAKIEAALSHDAALSGAVQQLQADLL